MLFLGTDLFFLPVCMEANDKDEFLFQFKQPFVFHLLFHFPLDGSIL